MEKLLCSLAAIFAAVLSAHAMEGGPSSITEISTCEPCEIELYGKIVSIKIGANWTDPQNSCFVYRCISPGQVQRITEECSAVEGQCVDGKASYYIPRQCCASCAYTNPIAEGTQGFRLNSSIPDPDPEPEDSWGEWTEWTRCSRDCGTGRQSRMRECLFENKARINCSGDRVQIQECNTQHCPVHGGWTRWSEWSDCSETCGNGTQSRARTCTDPAPNYGGRDCVGEPDQVRKCFLRHCPVHCVWEPWTDWTACSLPCGGGLQFQTREKQVEKYGGRPCEGPPVQNRTCNTHFCPINGGWTAWSNWTDCSRTCGNGTRQRDRSCTAPSRAYGGKPCVGQASQVQECFVIHCPIHCEWLEFSEWSSCSASCDGGIISRTREFVPAQFDGDDCSGDAMEVLECNTEACPDPCTDNGHPCYDNVSCTKVTDTEFMCGACPRGLRGDGRGQDGCQNVNECKEASPCFPGAECDDLAEGYQCGICPQGFIGDGLRGRDIDDTNILIQVCEDVNECQVVSNGGCDERRECENTMGSFVCGPCPAGYSEDGLFGCQFTNPCAAGVHNCEDEDYCVNHEEGQFYCYCPLPLIGNGLECSNDTDLDGIPDSLLTIGCEGPEKCFKDNCPRVPNSGQGDVDGDGLGDACDDDIDDDGLLNEKDNCMYDFNPEQGDNDYDRLGNACDNCLFVYNIDQIDTDWDGEGDRCDTDRDGDGVLNNADNCPINFNPQQRDSDRDRWGDICDNCITKWNRDQADKDEDSIGDACDNDVDNDKDGAQDNIDNCLTVSNADQVDTDEDGLGDPCDEDDDSDGFLDQDDNCPLVSNSNQQDENGNGVGDACEVDSTGDGVLDAFDTDGDTVPDAIDVCPANKEIHHTDFFRHKVISLSASSRTSPRWSIKGNGTEVHQAIRADPSLLVGYDMFSSVEFTGTLFVDTVAGDDYVGFAFNFQSNRRFMLVSWKQNSQFFWTNPSAEATAGLQIRVVKSNKGPSNRLVNALWHGEDTKNQVKIIYQDPLRRGWEDRTPYRWNLQYSSESMCMRLRVHNEDGLFADTGCVCDTSIRGGRLGLYAFAQENIIFSNLRYRSLGLEAESELAQCQVV